jgi:hypothetical protein
MSPTMSAPSVDTVVDPGAGGHRDAEPDGPADPGSDDGGSDDGTPPEAGHASARRTSVGPPVLSIAIYLILAALLFWPVWSTHPTTVSEVGGDQFATMWFLQWAPHSVLHGLNPFFSQYANHPFGVNLLTNTSVLLLGWLVSPVTLLWGPIASFNVLITLALPASATAGYFFARRWVTWWPAAFVAGLLYGFSPYEIAQSAGHLNLTFMVIPPLLFLVLHELAVRQRGRAARWGIVFGLLATAQFFVSSEVLASTAVVGAIALVATAWFGRHLIRVHARYFAIGAAWAAGTAAVLLAYPLWFALKGPGSIHGAIQLVPQGYRADLLGPVVPDSLLRLAPHHLATVADRFANSITENGSYLGITLLLVLAVGVVLCWRGSVVVRVAAITGAAAFIISLGGGLVVKGNPPGSATGFPLPERIFTKLPVLSNTIPVRYSLYMVLCAALLLALFLERLHHALATRRLHPHRDPAKARHDRRVVAVVVPLAVAVVALVPLYPVAPMAGIAPVGTPAYFTSPQLSNIPKGSVALLYPYPSSVTPNAQAWQAVAKLSFAMPGGYFLVPSGPDRTIAFSPELSYTRATLTARVLTGLESGRAPTETPALRSALRAQWQRWGVDSLVVFPEGEPNPAAVVRFFTWVVGGPASHGPGGAYTWYRLLR